MIKIRNYKFRIYPNNIQQTKLQKNLEVCRWVYNKFVEQAQKSHITRNDMNYILTELKQSESWLYNYHSKMLQMVSTKLEGSEKAILNLAKKGFKTGKIKFIKFNEYRTFTYNQSGFKLETHNGKALLYLSKIGYIEIRKHREIPDNTNIKQVSVTKSKSNKWYVCITCDIIESTFNIPKISFVKSVGIDVGVKSFVYDSNGFQFQNPLNLKKELKSLYRIQRRVSRRKKGANNRLKIMLHLQRIHERIVNRRKDFQHKLSYMYSQKKDVVFVEDLKIQKMTKNHRLARSIMDSSWGSFLEKLEYKCKLLIKVPSRNTSVDCSRCGNKVPKNLAIRIHRCDRCNLILDRDYNASINILKKGFKILNLFTKENYHRLPQELREVMPVEISMRPLKQEESTQFFGGSSQAFVSS